MCCCWRAEHDTFSVNISLALKASVSSRSIGMHCRPHLNDILHKRDDLVFRVIKYSAQAYSPEPFGLQHLYSNDDQGLGRAGLTAFHINRLRFIANGNVSFIDFYKTAEQLSARANHRTTKAMKQGPRCLIASKSQNALQPQGADAMFLIGDVPRGGQPYLERCSRFVENRSCGHAGLVTACLANQSVTTCFERCANDSALRTNELLRPA
ncbi:hypothetical protein SAMN04244579_04681 [Azotobacter beijerinckii]|uniref:Uncharacterized protein n=1 Tax=Azotobacter beijerinckii TaxID=170623 RepID=A0A1H6ZRV4_9GAMM|nr:hypothetical protein SAMN04244579_04681 [Azotobacter beijerinckii]